ncbi:hypothetical protein Leryth_011297 [Lithospermum erythrorhizon]|nr:hypothetical protein Leryth_011297 [Lithospermum erythrorhizon]
MMTTFCVALQSPKTLKHLLHHSPLPFLHSLSSITPSPSSSPPPLSSSTPNNNNNNKNDNFKNNNNNNIISETKRVFGIEPKYLCCSMADKRPLKVAVLVSGGVDSSVALRLLHAAGHSCTAFYLKIWFQEDFENFWSECPWETDLNYARAVCDQVDVTLEVVHLTDEYWKNVVSYIIAEYRSGRTPNPDVLCNTRIKFGAFMDAISAMEFDYVASGHYAKVMHSSLLDSDEPSILQLSKDMVKDQTYFLSHLSPEQLKRLIFPLGSMPKCFGNVKTQEFTNEKASLCFTSGLQNITHLVVVLLRFLFFWSICIEVPLKILLIGTFYCASSVVFWQCQDSRRMSLPDEVRGLAKALNLPNQDRKDSQGICFLGKIKFSEFVARHIGEEEGPILEAETGDLLGNHRGFWFYTIGQRQGLRLPGGPWYVVEKDVKNNVVFVSRNYYSVDKRRRLFRVGSLKWISGFSPAQVNEIQCKVRHGPGFYNCTLTVAVEENGNEVAVVQLAEDDQGLAAGQFAAFYKSDTCIGSGVILESWDDQGFPLCARALEMARMEDKSKLGKPVKIKNKPESISEESDHINQNKDNVKVVVETRTAACG